MERLADQGNEGNPVFGPYDMRQPSSLLNEAYLRMAQRDGRPTGTYGAVTGAGPSRVLEFGLKLIP